MSRDIAVTSPTADGGATDLIGDANAGLMLWRYWIGAAWDDIAVRYKRTVFGMVWLPASFLAFIGAQAAVFSFLNTADFVYFLSFLTLGFLAWQFISSLIVDACTTFISAYGFIHTRKLPYTVFVYHSVARNTITFVMTLPAALALVVFSGEFHAGMASFALLAVLVWLINGFAIGITLGVLCARHRDVMHVIATIMRVLFFITPIVWLPQSLGAFGAYAALNPFTHFIDVFRRPILDGVVPLQSWIVVLCFSVVSVAIAALVFSRFKSKIIYWL